MNILGIDPGTGRTGWGVVRKVQSSIHSKSSGQEFKVQSSPKVIVGVEYVGHGCVVTSQDAPMHKRLEVLYKSVKKIIKDFSPDCMIIEHIFFGKNTKTAIAVGQARGVVMLSAAQRDLPIYEYTGISVKYHLSGHGRSDKKDMQKIVRKLLNRNKRTLSFNAKDKGFDDAADALAIAIHHSLKTA